MAAMICGILMPGGATAGDPDLHAGDVAQYALPALALVETYRRGDAEGRRQWLDSVGATFLTTQALKWGLNDTAWGTRPNGGHHSFPSGHTSAAFSGAFFLTQRYGWSVGWPAVALAGVTAYSRVDERVHHPRDVIAGCALAYGFAYAWVKPAAARQTVIPVLMPGYAGIAVAASF